MGLGQKIQNMMILVVTRMLGGVVSHPLSDFGDFDRVLPGETEFSSGRIVLARQSWTTEPLGSGWFGQIQVRTTKNPGSVTESNLTKIGLSKSIFFVEQVYSTLRRNSFVPKKNRRHVVFEVWWWHLRLCRCKSLKEGELTSILGESNTNVW